MSIEPDKTEMENLRCLLELARSEDLHQRGDVTGALVAGDATATATFVAREELVLCGAAVLKTIAFAYDNRLETIVCVEEGEQVGVGAVLAEWRGPARAMLAAERVALNFLQRLSGIATMTRQYVRAVAGADAGIFDTRKTTPGWRELEKYAVRAGGGRNHRKGLYDAILIKDNHLAILEKTIGAEPIAHLRDELARVRQSMPDLAFIELEVDTLEQLGVALTVPLDIVLLDNMSAAQLRRAVRMRDDAGLAGRVELEASGGITLDNVREVAETGVERIAIGALTHSARAVDIALDIEID